MSIQEGDTFPAVDLMTMKDGSPAPVNTGELFKDKKVALFAVPGAFTPGCSKTHCPSFVLGAEKLKQKGVDLIACVAVNDVFVMDAWCRDQKAEGKILFLADGSGVLSKKIGMELDLISSGLGMRCKRFAMIIENNVVKHLAVDAKGIKDTTAEALLSKL